MKNCITAMEGFIRPGCVDKQGEIKVDFQGGEITGSHSISHSPIKAEPNII